MIFKSIVNKESKLHNINVQLFNEILEYFFFCRVKDSQYLVEAFNVDRIYLKHQHQGRAPDYRVSNKICLIRIILRDLILRLRSGKTESLLRKQQSRVRYPAGRTGANSALRGLRVVTDL